MPNQPGIVLFFADYQSIKDILTIDQKGQLFDALMRFGETEESYLGDDQLIRLAFNVFSAAIIRTNTKYENRCRVNAENIRKRWEQKKAVSVVSEYDRIQSNTNEYNGPENKTETEIETKTKRKRFISPSLEEVSAYCQERGNGISAEQFIDYYQARGWELKPGQKMKDWKAAIRTWEQNNKGWRNSNGLRGSVKEDRVPGQRDLYNL